MPTFEVLDEYADPIVQITDRQGVVTTVQVDRIDTGDEILDGKSFLSFPLSIADGIYALIDWGDFRRAYISEGGYTVTTANEQDIKGQLDFAIIDDDGKSYELQSISTMVLVGLSKTWLPFISAPRNLTGHRWEIHVLKPMDLTFIVIRPDFAFEYSVTTTDAQGNVISTSSDYANTEFFSLGPGDVDRKLSSYDEISLNKDDQITAKANDVETTGTFFIIPEFTSGVTFLTNKGRTPNWYLQAYLVESGLTILLKKPVCTLTKITN
jgi:hypothetical protein